MRRKVVALLGASLLLAGCASVVESRVESGLVDAGIPSGPAACMAAIWAEDLSVEQIRGISTFIDGVRDEGDDLTAGRLIGYVSEWNDPRALAVVTASAARCAFS